jgi:hypothetical protein
MKSIDDARNHKYKITLLQFTLNLLAPEFDI